MDILVLGGTGAMGTPLVEFLKNKNDEVYVTTRQKKDSEENIHFIQGNMHDKLFLNKVLEKHYNAIIDFMVYKTSEFKELYRAFLERTDQYFYISSSRVYSDSGGVKIYEESPRLLDVCMDREYLETDEYALAKARQENLLLNCNQKNWTIIRPYITYNRERLQLGVYEKEQWLYRTLKGKKIVFPTQIAEKMTSLTYAVDVAAVIVKLIGNEDAYGELFQVVTDECIQWRDVLNIYLDALEEKTGKRPEVVFTDDISGLSKVLFPAQIKYDRLYDRSFDSSKVNSVINQAHYKRISEGISECLYQFLDNPKWKQINWKYEAWADRISGDRATLKEIKGYRNKVRYLKCMFRGI